MCGIAGQISLGGVLRKASLINMLRLLHHRGPDGSGLYLDDKVNLGMRRLSIIDLVGGGQPLYNENKSVIVVGNGEIYNYVELRKKLEDNRHNFRTKSDIETIVHLYEEYGEKAWSKLRGMFAFALYDKRDGGKVYLVRDRFGEKPLYYHQNQNVLFFSSELRSLLSVMGDICLDMESVEQFSRYYYVIEPKTIVSGVKKLDAGSFLTINFTEGKIENKKYWFPDDIIPSKGKNTTRSIRNVLEESCMLTLRADVQVGLALSGGIDSSAILALSAPHYKDALVAFSVGYKGRPPTDERAQAEKLARSYGVSYYETEIDDEEIVGDFPQLVFDCDEPIADIAAHSIRSLYRLSHKHGIKVILGGIGGDEMFWGYPSTIAATHNNKKHFLGWARNFWKKRYYSYSNPDPTENNWLGCIAGQKLESLDQKALNPLVVKSFPVNDLDIGKKSLSLLRELWLKGNCIAINDRLSMSASVELRSPFLDYKLAELVYGDNDLVSGFNKSPKSYLKEALKDVLPNEILNRPKRGFTPPVGKWLKLIIDGYSNLVRDGYLTSRGIISRDKVVKYLETWGKLSNNWYSVYQLIILEVWSREMLLNQKPEELKIKR